MDDQNVIISTPERDMINDKKFKINPVIHSNPDNSTFMDEDVYQDVEAVHEPVSLIDMEKQMIKKTLDKHRGRRKPAADELKISERTLYRKIKEYGLE